MGCSLAEFAAALPAAMRDWRISGGPVAWQVADAAGRHIASISISPLPARRLGALSLPVLSVTLDLGEVPAALREEFLRRFERGFHRGGG